MVQTSLVAQTLQALKERPRIITYKLISQETKISESWLKDFAQGNITEPGAAKIQTLFEYLTGSKLL